MRGCIAGDLLPNPTVEQRIATGFGRNHVINSEGGIIEEEYRVSYVADRVRTLGMAWLGLTLECARCHNHKFDPIMQRDYYRFFAFFNNVPETGEDGRVANAFPTMPAPTRAQEAKMRELESAISALQARIDRREKTWSWREESATQALRLAAQGTIPDGAVFQLQCESPYQGFALADGVAGQACATGDALSKPQIEDKKVPVSKRQPLTFSFWLRPDAGNMDAALFSTMDYATSPAGTSFGKGLDLRLAAGELEFRFADRFPAYSIRVRSEGAGISAGQWRHLALVYQAATDSDEARAQASWVAMFVDGREVPVRVLNDGLSLPEAKGDKPGFPSFRIGWDTSSNGARYAGRFDEIAIWPRALTGREIARLFEGHAIPYAVARQRERQSSPAEIGWLRAAVLKMRDKRYAEDQQKLDTLRAEWHAVRRSFPTVMVMEEMSPPRQTKILLHGMYNTPGENVDAGVPEELLGAWPAGAPKNRLGLAQWLTKPDHPLTSRVVVNRFWQQLFGQGLVQSSDNFGMQGDSPSHPDLLDWLAREFVDSGWKVKTLMKRNVLSATYRQDSAAPAELIARDPENRLLARGPRFRLPAEIIRDQALQISGLLINRLGGPSVHPYQPEDLYKGIVVAANYPGTKYVQDKGDDLYRRSIYTFWKRTVPHPTMVVFDAPDREFCIVRRAATNTPLQALTLLNDPIFVEAARKLAERSIHEGGSSPNARLEFAFRLATGRPPDDQEKEILRKKLAEVLAIYQADEASARSLVTVGESQRDPAISLKELAAYTAVANMILNLDEVITKG